MGKIKNGMEDFVAKQIIQLVHENNKRLTKLNRRRKELARMPHRRTLRK
jgi:hypothetical protein